MDIIQKYTVTEINNIIKNLFGEIFPNKIVVSGEISNLKIANGNLFLTLKDDESNVNVVSWGYAKSKNKVDLNNGDQVAVTCRMSFYAKTGNLNLNLLSIEKLGLGELHKKYELLKEKCQKLGYFDSIKKKQFPNNVKYIGIATAPEGAALQDILYVLKKNNFYGKIIIKRCTVQGATCPKSIVKAIENLENWKDQDGNKLDIILVTRGGGSFEDLMGFSDLKVIEKINKCKIYTISAVGHEIDFMLSDFSADMRAPTPSIAAEIISKQQKKEIDMLEMNKKFFEEYLKNLIIKKIEMTQYRLDNLKPRILKPDQIIDNKKESLKNIYENLTKNINDKLLKYDNNIQLLERKLEKYDMDKMLNSGYILLMKGGKIYDSIEDLSIGQKLKIKMKNGEAEILINKILKNDH